MVSCSRHCERYRSIVVKRSVEVCARVINGVNFERRQYSTPNSQVIQVCRARLRINTSWILADIHGVGGIEHTQFGDTRGICFDSVNEGQGQGVLTVESDGKMMPFTVVN